MALETPLSSTTDFTFTNLSNESALTDTIERQEVESCIYVISEEVKTPTFSEDFLNQYDLIKCDPDDASPELVSDLDAKKVIFATDAKNNQPLPSVEELKRYQTAGIEPSVHLLSLPGVKNIKGALLDQIENYRKNDIPIRWSVSALLTYYSYKYMQRNGLKKAISTMCDHAGIEGGTLSSHIRENHKFMSRTWLKFRTALGISATDEGNITDLSFLGIEPDRVQGIKEDLDKIIAMLLQIEVENLPEVAPGKTLIGSQVLELFTVLHPEFSDSNDTRLSTIVYDKLDELGIEDPRKPLIEEIVQISSQIRKLPDRAILETMRHTKIGDMIEEFAQLAFQIDDCCSVPEYSLTTIRDGMGNIRKATDIIDYVAFYPSRKPNMQKAYFEQRSDQYVKIAEGTITFENSAEDPLIVNAIYRTEEGEIYKIIPNEVERVLLKYSDGGLWAAYEDAEDENQSTTLLSNYSLKKDRMQAQLLGDPKREAIMAGASSFLSSPDFFQKNQWCVGIEIKKAGSKSVDHIINQLRRQRDAILRLREQDPTAIGAAIGEIVVVALHPNKKLQEGILKLNEEMPFFGYLEFSALHKSFGADLCKRLENSTLSEAIAFEEFFSRINSLLSAEPTLMPIDELYTGYPAKFTAEVDNDNQSTKNLIKQLETLFDNEEQKKNYVKHRNNTSEKQKAASELFSEFKQLICRNHHEITELDLQSLFEKHFPEDSYHETGRRGSMIVHEDVSDPETGERKLISFPRPLQGILSRHRLSEWQTDRFSQLLHKVEKIAEEHFGKPNLINLSDPEALESFLQNLKEQLTARDEMYTLEAEIEDAFLTNLFHTRLTHGDENDFNRYLSMLPVDHKYRRSSITARVQAGLFGDEINLEQALLEQFLISSYISLRASEPPKDEQVHSNPYRFHLLERLVKDHPTRAEQQEKIRAALEPILLDISHFCHTRASKLACIPDFDRWFTTLSKIKEAHQLDFSSCEHSLAMRGADSTAIDSKINVAGLKTKLDAFCERHSLEEIAPGLNDRIQGERNDKDMGGLDHSLNLPFQETPSGWTLFRGFVSEFDAALGLDDEPSDSLKNILEKIGNVALQESSPIVHYIKTNQKVLERAASSEINLIEEQHLISFSIKLIQRASLLSELDPELGIDYFVSSFRGLFQFPDAFEDFYYPRIVETQAQLHDRENAAAALAYTHWLKSQEECPLIPTGRDLIRRLSLLHLQTSQHNKGSLTVDSSVAQQFFTLIKEQQFQKAFELELQYAGPTRSIISRIFSSLSMDPHLIAEKRQNFERHFEETDIPAQNALQNYIKHVDELVKASTDILVGYDDERNIVRFRDLPDRAETKFKMAMHRILTLSAKRYRLNPDLFRGDREALFDPLKYKGFREYNEFKRTLQILTTYVPDIVKILCLDPGGVSKYCDYRRGPMFLDEQTHSSSIKSDPKRVRTDAKAKKIDRQRRKLRSKKGKR